METKTQERNGPAPASYCQSQHRQNPRVNKSREGGREGEERRSCSRGGEVVDEDAGALGEGEEGVLVEGNVAIVGAPGELLLDDAPDDGLGELLRLAHHLRRRRLH